MIPVQVIPRFELISEIINDFRNRGYQLEFRREATCLYCIGLSFVMPPENFTVDEIFHFADASNTDKERMLYAVSSIHALKGFLLDACSVYDDNISPEMAQKLHQQINHYEKL
jgi:hypothetical protein